MKTTFCLCLVSLLLALGSGCQQSVKIEDQSKNQTSAPPKTEASAAAPTPAPAPSPAAAAPAASTPTSPPPSAATQPPKETPPVSTNEVAVIKTALGEMVVEFWPDVAPNTVENFKKLTRQGFYDGTAFHRIVKGFMIQGGDPLTKDESKMGMWGTGDPGYKIKAEFNNRSHQRGVLSMARSNDPDSAGSQFFICLGDASFLDGKYTAFGKLIKGDEVLGKLGDVETAVSPGGEKSRPVQRQGVESIKLVPAESVK
jgi:peptidyl-prolyl cis-trans isomerase B (cyclophilin B)